MSTPHTGPSEAEKRLEAERARTDVSPAQPDDASRIDDDGVPDAPAHVKREHGDRLEH